MLLLTYIVGLVITSLAQSLLMRVGGDDKMLAMMRIAVVLQDVFVFVLPAVVTALIVTRQPVRLLALGSAPTGMQTLLAVFVMLVSSPFMSWVIELNASVHLPESMAALEASLRAMENAAESTVQMMLGARTPGNLVVSVLIVGVLAGFSEELFFRGALQRLLSTTAMSPALAIWISAFIFSALHFQFFGFVPRLLLGAFFGYLLLWSGSIWLPMLVHALNNSLFVILQHFTGNGEPQFGMAFDNPFSVAISAVLTAIGLALLYKQRIKSQG